MNIQGVTPNIAAPLQAQSASSARATTNGSSSTTGSSGLLGSSTSLQDTFLNLLVTELKNQDPTSPVDPTQMVGQMVSLNQLDQLIAINSTLTTMSGGAASTAASGSGSAATAKVASGNAVSSASPQNTSATAGSSNSPTQSVPIPADANAMMNLYGTAVPVSPAFNVFSTGGK